MNLKIYHMYHKPEHVSHLETSEYFIPYNNIINEHPQLYEYPFMKKILAENKNYDGHWGIISWKWRSKTLIPGDKFTSWIEKNPGYDSYVMNPFIGETIYPNMIVQGEVYHPGMLSYFDRLLKILGYNIDIANDNYPLNILSYCNYYVGNRRFWTELINFFDLCIEVSKNDEILNDFMFNKTFLWRGSDFIHFAFIIERLHSLFLRLTGQKFKSIHYPDLERLETGACRSGETELYPFLIQKGIELYKDRI